jgi:hypothetical protein
MLHATRRTWSSDSAMVAGNVDVSFAACFRLGFEVIIAAWHWQPNAAPVAAQ